MYVYLCGACVCTGAHARVYTHAYGGRRSASYMIPQLALTTLVLAQQARLVDQRTLRTLLSLLGFPAHGIKPGFIVWALEMNSGSQA